MKKIIMTSLTALSLVMSLSVMAITTPMPEKTDIKKVENKTENKAVESTINLYESPELNSKVIKKLPIFADLIAIYHQGDWLKVGDREDGSTGWINVHQYNEAKNNYYHTHFQTNMQSVYLQAEKNNKGQTEVVAYRDGKKLTPVEAKELYDHMQAKERKQWEAMQHFNQVMDQQMQMDYLNARRAMDAAF